MWSLVVKILGCVEIGGGVYTEGKNIRGENLRRGGRSDGFCL